MNFELEACCFVDYYIEASVCNELIFEESIPVRYRKLAGNDYCLFDITIIQDLFEVVLELPLNRLHAKVIYDYEIIASHSFKEPEFFPLQTSKSH